MQELRIQKRHGQGPQDNEAHRESNDRPVLAMARAFYIKGGCQVSFELFAGKVIEAKRLSRCGARM